MKRVIAIGLISGLLYANAVAQEIDLGQYPSAVIANDDITMRIFLPDVDNGFYRGSRFDWSGVIGSLKYRGHEFFGLWRDSHNPTSNADITGPVEGYIKGGLGYDEAATGEGFARIGIGVLKKIDEDGFDFRHTYDFLDHGSWNVSQGGDWITFRHELETDFGYAYVYEKTIRLTSDGFLLQHSLQNMGEKPIETDQFNHNFLVIDGDKTGSDFTAEYPFRIATDRDTRGMARLEGNEVHYTQNPIERSLLLTLTGFSDSPDDHLMIVRNHKSGAGVSIKGDQPLKELALWANPNTLCPENFIEISVDPGKTMTWMSTYTLLVD